MNKTTDTKTNRAGYFGDYGGQFIPEILRPAIEELDEAWQTMSEDREFNLELQFQLHHYAGRPTALYPAENLTRYFGRGRIFLKREDLNHTGAHKINNAIGQILLAKRIGKTRIIAETGAGQHGVATATVAARAGMQCKIYMGADDMARQQPNVLRMQMLGAEVEAVHSGSKTLKDATNEAMRDWLAHVADTHYIIGSAVGPHPFPEMVRAFQSVIGHELLKQIPELAGGPPNYLVACVGGGSNAIGMFYPFIEHQDIQMIGVEAGGLGLDSGKHAATLTLGEAGIFHGMRTYLLQDANGNVQLPHSISAGLDYPGVGPEHSYLKDMQRVRYVTVSDEQALQAAYLLTRLEGIIPALESAHALAYLPQLMPQTNKQDIVVVNLSGRGDKDMDTYIRHMGDRR